MTYRRVAAAAQIRIVTIAATASVTGCRIMRRYRSPNPERTRVLYHAGSGEGA